MGECAALAVIRLESGVRCSGKASICALGADAVRSFCTNRGTVRRCECVPITGDAPHAITPRALGEPEPVAVMNSVQRRDLSGGNLIRCPTDRIDTVDSGP